jgi:hypothetical protein
LIQEELNVFLLGFLGSETIFTSNLVEINVQKVGVNPHQLFLDLREGIRARIQLQCLQIYQVFILLVELQYIIPEARSTDNIVFKSGFLPHINDC